MNLDKKIRQLLNKVGSAKMSTTAYDTAWIARLGELGEPIGEKALMWLRENQLPDGSWGAKRPCYYHDRVISTLAAVNALARRRQARDRNRLRKAEKSLEISIHKLDLDRSGETVGFELIVPTLLYEAKALGAIYNQEFEILQNLAPKRTAKLAALPKRMINRFVSTAFSSEMAGTDGINLLDTKNLQEKNGSIGFCPSATAYYVLYVRRRDPLALQYLRKVAANGTAPNAYPFDIFEQTVVLWNLALIKDTLNEDLLSLCRKKLDILESAWEPGEGVGFATGYAPKDGDDTSILHEAFTRFNHPLDIEAILSYEEPFCFRCYNLESTPSISANIHVLSALRRAGFSKDHSAIQKIIYFLKETQISKNTWFDKWHTSPYYNAAQAVIACTNYADEIVEGTIEWILNTQREEGSWGYFMPTAEETAYCLQALSTWEKYKRNSIPQDVLKKGKDWLVLHMDPPYPPLWLAKCLYCPELIVRSIILSAIRLTQVII